MTNGRSASPIEGLRYRSAAARRLAVVDLVQRHGFCRITDLSDQLGVSRITVRRDVAQLETDNLVRSAHGGVIAPVQPGPGTHFALRSGSHAEAKRAIANKAIEYVSAQPRQLLGIDAGTTGFEAARLLAPETPLKVITHSLPVMMELAERPRVEVVGIGGVLHPETQAFAGPSTVAGYARLRIGTLLLTASAVRNGVMYCGNAFDADTKRQMMAIADEVVLLVDASKFKSVAPFQVADLSSVTTVIVDHETSADLRRDLEQRGLTVVVADPPGAASR